MCRIQGIPRGSIAPRRKPALTTIFKLLLSANAKRPRPSSDIFSGVMILNIGPRPQLGNVRAAPRQTCHCSSLPFLLNYAQLVITNGPIHAYCPEYATFSYAKLSRTLTATALLWRITSPSYGRLDPAGLHSAQLYPDVPFNAATCQMALFTARMVHCIQYHGHKITKLQFVHYYG
ncbi:hypothetical protein LMH87_010951 [Akanthomyces muscarius]|uniref:Uncharacterized protein n=1 Tax=Akanthomyces muscarius TaxID=2231603 RepID=A0A9W8Q907_AKAMU|nr:hypothetical protein LMH87_010951 [Akanthomyces muscarius]KAJ4150189.1 hypothetical protein LMH87_010951 [Akanthomyces muscarius]